LKKPDPDRSVDTVHQGDQDGLKGVYYINAADEVTQYQVVLSCCRISEQFLILVLTEMLETFPLNISGFHAGNGSEYINHQVATLLNKLNIEHTKSRSRHSNDNALTGTPLASLRHKELWLQYAEMMLEGISIRKAASRVSIHKITLFRWRHRFLMCPTLHKPKHLTGIVEADETFFLESQKGERNLTRPAHK
jgi:hypothetical protein